MKTYDNVLKNGAKQSTIKNANRSLVLEVLNTMGMTSRTKLAEVTGLTKTSITNITTELISKNIICEVGCGESEIGRKPTMLDISNQSPCAIGISINRDFVYVSLVNLRGDLLSEESYVLHQTETQKSLIEGIYHCCDRIFKIANEEKKIDIIGIGVASIGPLDIKHGKILSPPHFKGLKDILIVEMLEKKYELPVFLDNDMNASAIAEKLFGYGKELTNFISMGVTNGIGAGVVINKKIYRGNNGFAGEVGHISIDLEGKKCPCGNRGCLELYAGIPFIVEETKKQLKKTENSLLNNLTDIRWLDIIDAAQKGDKVCINVIKKLAEYLSVGLITLINVYDPQVVFLGHEVVIAKELIIDELQKNINEKIFSKGLGGVEIRVSKFTDMQYKINGAAILIYNFFTGLIEE
ncbi:MAG: ROK family protein [Christensenellaceae bacterium]